MPDADGPDANGQRADASPPEPRERPLKGGLANAGQLVRVGDTVRRPPGPNRDAIHALLDHLGRVGFDGAPRLLGIDEKGRSIVSWIDGEVPMPPYPDWSAGAELLVSVAELQRRFHDAVRGFVAPAGAVWTTALTPGPPPADAVVGHNDLGLENVVCRDGRAVAFIDFDFAAPVDPLWDVAVALRHWVPFKDPDDLDEARAEVDQVARFSAYCDVYGVGADDRVRVVEHGLRFLDQAFTAMRSRAEAGLPAYVTMWEAGYGGQNRRAHGWLAANATRLVEA
jgi:hypothetical protein